jgi:protein phosphatase
MRCVDRFDSSLRNYPIFTSVSMLVCPQCSSKNPLRHRFCQKCGFSLVCRWAVIIDHSPADGEITTSQLSEGQSPAHLYLGARYQKLDLEVKSLSTNIFLVKVLDTLPSQSSPLQELMKQQPVDPNPARLGKLPVDWPEWELWERGGVIPAARPYLALHPLLGEQIPQLYDAWHRNDQTVLILEASDDDDRLAEQCQLSLQSSAQLADWCNTLLQLWVYLEPWSVRSSLLEVDNLYVNSPEQQIYLQRLISDSQPLALTDLTAFWLKILPDSPLRKSIATFMETADQLTIEQLQKYLQLQQIPEHSQITLGDPEPIVVPTVRELSAAAATDVGQQRDHNEDFYSIETCCRIKQNPGDSSTEYRGLYILCDGMGGHAAGEVASSMAIQELQKYWAEHWQAVLPSEEEIQQAIIFTNQALFEINQSKEAAGNGRMGTTLVLVMVQDNQVAIAHVGDSRCYILETSGQPVQITLDHEVGQREILRGVEPEIAYGRPDSYQLTQAIGPRDENSIDPEIQFFSLREDTLILLASDGLTDQDLLELHGEELLQPMVKKEISLAAGVDNLVDFANSYNGHDNITAIAVLVSIGK